MSVAEVAVVLTQSAADAWSRLGDFGSWHLWNQRIVATSLSGGSGRGPVGAVRHLTLADGSEVDERLDSYDDGVRALSYSFVGPSPFPVRNYTGHIRIYPVTAGGCFVRWWGTFDAELADEPQVSATLSRIYGAFLAALASASEPVTV